MKRATLQDIADYLRLSRSTVCRGLQNHPNTSKETRARIRRACKELGYRPDPILSALATSRWQGAKASGGVVIAYITCPSPSAGGLDLWSNFPEEAAVLGYGLEIFRREQFPSSAKLQRVLRGRGITDVIVGTVYEKSLTVDLDWDKFIAVQLLPGLLALPLHSVVRDHFSVVVSAWQRAVERGYQRIGAVLLEHPFPIIDDALRRSGVHTCQSFLFPHLPALPPLTYRNTDAEHIRKFVEWVKTNEPDVIIGFSASHDHLFRSEFGHGIPYISLHNTPPSELSGIHDAQATYVREAINLLNFCRRSNQWGIPKQRIDHVLEPTWVEGNSLPWKKAD